MDVEEAKAIFLEANQSYKNENFEKARDLYLQLEEDYSSFEYYYNLGNVFYKLDDIPSAILYYEKAHKIEPNNDDLETNLMIANQHVMDKIDAVPLSHVSEFSNEVFSAGNLFWWSLWSIIGIFLSFAFFILYKTRFKRKLVLGLGFMFLLVFVVNFTFGILTINRMNTSNEAIIFSEEVEVLSQPDGSQVEFVIHEGTKVYISENRGDWTEIKIANGNVGWIPSESYREI